MATTDGPPSDAVLVNLALAGDAQAFEQLIERHAGMVYAVARSHLDSHESAEDLVQEVFLRVHLSLHQLVDPTCLAPWMARLARNLAIDRLRQNQRRSHLVPMVPLSQEAFRVPNPQGKGVRDIMEANERAEATRRAINRLPAEQREVVMLHFGEEMKQVEIAGRLGVRPNRIHRLLRRAEASLRGMLAAELGEMDLREAMPEMQMPRAVVNRVATLIAAATVMSTEARAPLTAAAVATQPTIEMMAKGGALGLVNTIAAKVAAGGGIMATGKILIGVTAAALAAYLGYTHLTPFSSSTADRLVTNDPVTLAMDLSPGSSWAETTTAHGAFQAQAEMSATQTEETAEITLTQVSNCRILSISDTGVILVEHVISDARLEFDIVPSVGNRPLPDLNTGGNPLANLIGQRTLLTVTPRGDDISVDSEGSELMATFQEIGFMNLVFSIAGLPDEPIRPGDQWSRRIIFTGDREITVTCTGSLERIERVGEQRVALIHREIAGGLPSTRLPSEANPRMGGQEVSTMSVQMQMNAVGRLLIDEHRWLDQRGDFENTSQAETVVTGSRRGDFTRRVTQAYGLEYLTEFSRSL